jgi:type II secretory pathway pseudopilin PulG
MTHRKNHRRGWMMLEAITAVCLLSMMAMLLTVALRQQERGLKQLAEARAASRAAEAALTAMQSGQSRAVVESGEAKISVTELPEPSDAAGMEWVRVHADLAGRQAELIGLVPRQAMAMAAGGVP